MITVPCFHLDQFKQDEIASLCLFPKASLLREQEVLVFGWSNLLFCFPFSSSVYQYFLRNSLDQAHASFWGFSVYRIDVLTLSSSHMQSFFSYVVLTTPPPPADPHLFYPFIILRHSTCQTGTLTWGSLQIRSHRVELGHWKAVQEGRMRVSCLGQALVVPQPVEQTSGHT